MKRWLRRTAGAVLLVLTIRTVWLIGEREVARSAGEREYAASVAAAEAADPDWGWDALAAKRARPPEDRNSIDVVTRARAALPGDWAEPGGLPADPPGPANARLPADVAAAARARLAATAGGVALARSLKDYPQGYYPLALDANPWQTPLPHLDAVRRVAPFLRWDGAEAADAGDTARAWDAADALLNLSRSPGDEPFLISQLVRVSVRVSAVQHLERLLAQGEPDPARLEAAQAAWAAEADEPLLLYGLRGERAVNDATFEHLLDGSIRQAELARGGDMSAGWFGSYGWWLYKGKLWRDRAALHDYMTQAVVAARLPAHEQRAALARLTPPPEERKVAALLTPAVEKTATACWRSTAHCRCAAVALACERHRRAHGRWPDRLEELTPALLPAVPLDPLDGQPLRYRRLPDGAVVYSVGTNRNDDGGNLDRASPDSPLTPDEGVRLWDMSARRAGP